MYSKPSQAFPRAFPRNAARRCAACCDRGPQPPAAGGERPHAACNMTCDLPLRPVFAPVHGMVTACIVDLLSLHVSRGMSPFLLFYTPL